MQTMMHRATVTVGGTCLTNPCSVSPSCGAASVQCVRGGSSVTLTTRMPRLRADCSSRSVSRRNSKRLQRVVVRAEQSSGLNEQLKQVASEEDEAGDDATGRDAAVHVASDSAVEEPGAFFKDVEADATVVAADRGRSVEDSTVDLLDKAEDLEERQEKEAALLQKNEFGGAKGANEGEMTREKAQGKIVETLHDGFEILKWAAEGVVSLGQNTKGVIDKRLKSVGVAADDTKSVSQQVKDVAQQKFEEVRGSPVTKQVTEVAQKKLEDLQESTAKFGEELQVSIKEKKAADSLRPETETNPLAKAGQELQENFAKATSEDGPLAKLSQKVSENISRVTKVTTEKAEEPSTSSQQPEGNPLGKLKDDYEDEEGNELVKDAKPDKETSYIFETDSPQAIPSKPEGSDIGPDE